jgi:hypothetical protein
VTVAQGVPMAVGAARTVRAARGAALVITVMIGVGSFAMSFAALRDLAVRAGSPPRLAWVWPLIVDGAILMATVAIVALVSFTGDRRGRRFFWWVLVCSAAVSVGGNGLHAILPRAVPLSPWLAAGIAVVPPAMLLAATHGLAVLSRVGAAAGAQCTTGDEAAGDSHPRAPGDTDPAETAPAVATATHRWAVMAAALAERRVAKGLSTGELSAVLVSSYERQLTNRAIGREFNLDPRTVGRIVAAGAELLRTGQLTTVTEAGRAAS